MSDVVCIYMFVNYGETTFSADCSSHFYNICEIKVAAKHNTENNRKNIYVDWKNN